MFIIVYQPTPQHQHHIINIKKEGDVDSEEEEEVQEEEGIVDDTKANNKNGLGKNPQQLK